MFAQLVPFLAATASALVLVPVCRIVARRFGFVAQPRSDRWHREPTPLLGGVAIGVTVFLGVAYFGGVRHQPVLVGCAGLMFLVGLLDDLISLKPSTKLIAQIVLASAFVFSGLRLNWSSSLTLDSVLTIVWVVGLTNAFNLLDNMDGLCAGVAVIAGLVLLMALPQAEAGTAMFFQARYIALLLGAMVGFLAYNVHPASVFMGDAGSLFIGISLAGVTLVSAKNLPTKSPFLSIIMVPVLVLLIPILDTTLVTVSRILQGRSAAAGGRDHTSHRLVAIGLSERGAVAVLWALAAVAGLAGWATRSLDSTWSVLLASIFLVAMAIFAVYLARVRVYEDTDAETLAGTGKITPIVATFMYKRRVAEVMLDFCLVTIAYYAAYRLRFEDWQLATTFQYFLQSLPLVLACQMSALFVAGAYRGIWRYFSLADTVVFVKATLAGTLGTFVILYLYDFRHYSRSAFVIYALLLLGMLIASRASFRLISDVVSRSRHGGRRLVIYGAGDGGAIAVRELLGVFATPYRMLGFIDDDPEKVKVSVHGYPVLGGYNRLVELVGSGGVDCVVISTSRVPDFRVGAVLRMCAAQDVAVSRLHFRLEELLASTRPASGASAQPPAPEDSHKIRRFDDAVQAKARRAGDQSS
jgi:UDP-GlcNAc:undecaprenyl-phosphate/decaprenyl-phosphate GlcNAc-1-phosphate transferase